MTFPTDRCGYCQSEEQWWLRRTRRESG